MRLDLSLSQRPEMQLRLSPQLIQRIEILQLPANELIDLIQQEVAENETIEAEPPKAQAPTQNGTDTGTTSGAETTATKEDVAAQQLEDYRRYDELLRPKINRSDDRDAKMEAMQNVADHDATLQEHLLAQISFANLPEKVRGFAEILVQHLDENGFLTEPLEEVLIPHDTEYSIDDAKKALEFIKELEPVGIGAKDLRECFLMQLDPEHPNFELHKQMVGEHLDDWRDNRLPKIAKACNVDVERVKEAMEELKHLLHPPPGRRFRAATIVPVVPDVVVEKIEDRYEVRLEDDYYPTLSISPSYLDMYRDKTVDSKSRRDIRGKIERARFLIEAIEQRRNTLFKVAREIVRHQEEFLEHGRLKPLKMRDVADTLGLHVSTVSRAISDKWIQTPRGVHPMKFFFTGAAPGGESAGLESRDSVRHKVKQIIEGEDKHAPLSDEDVVEKLRALGLDIARRTVTKYRKMLKIPSSRQRRAY